MPCARNTEGNRKGSILRRDLSGDEESSENRRDRLQCRHAVFPRYQLNAQYRRLANNYLVPPPSFPSSPVAPSLPPARLHHLRSFSLSPRARSACLSLCEEILIRARLSDGGGCKGGFTLARLPLKNISPGRARARGATKVSVRSRLTANFGDFKERFSARLSIALSRDHARMGIPIPRGRHVPSRVGAPPCDVTRSAIGRYRSYASLLFVPYCLPRSLSLSFSL